MLVHELRMRREDLQNELKHIEEELFQKTQIGWIGLTHEYVHVTKPDERRVSVCLAPISAEAKSPVYLSEDTGTLSLTTFEFWIDPHGKILMLNDSKLGAIQFGYAPHRIGEFKCFATYSREEVVDWIESIQAKYSIVKEKPVAPIEGDDDEV